MGIGIYISCLQDSLLFHLCFNFIQIYLFYTETQQLEEEITFSLLFITLFHMDVTAWIQIFFCAQFGFSDVMVCTETFWSCYCLSSGILSCHMTYPLPLSQVGFIKWFIWFILGFHLRSSDYIKSHFNKFDISQCPCNLSSSPIAGSSAGLYVDHPKHLYIALRAWFTYFLFR